MARTISTPLNTKFVEKALGRRPAIREIAGDASTRRFFRVSSGTRSAVLVVHPDPLPPDAPLYSNHRILSAIGAPVPRILGRHNGSGSVLFEDLGNTTLQKYLARRRPAVPASWRRLYRQACDLIALLHREGAGRIRPDDFAGRNRLDRDRFLFELDHFHRHFIVGLKRRAPGSADQAILRAFYDDLAMECDRQPRVYCHRDFQSRNLMVAAGRIRIIDFQDARLGPWTYDAASLLRDSSLDLPEALVEEMLDHLCRAIDAGPEEFRRDFDLMALQRNIKDLGTFGYMATVRGMRSYLDYVPRTIRSVRAALIRSPRHHLFHDTIERYILS
jgi:aminoglycoside/choline kinase family phosphotransferase